MFWYCLSYFFFRKDNYLITSGIWKILSSFRILPCPVDFEWDSRIPGWFVRIGITDSSPEFVRLRWPCTGIDEPIAFMVGGSRRIGFRMAVPIPAVITVSSIR